MTFIAKAKQIRAGSNVQMPTPDRPEWVEIKENAAEEFIPEHLTDEEKEDLRSAALALTNALASPASANAHNVPFAGQPDRSAAALNMRHFRHGDGEDIVYGSDDIEDLFDNLTANDAPRVDNAENQFLDAMFDKMQMGGDRSVSFLSENATNSSHRDYGTPWFGVRSEGDTWHYAIGAFQFAYGGVGIRRGPLITLYWRVYIYDRYNWNLANVTLDDGTEVVASEGITMSDNIDWLLIPNSTVRAAGDIDFVEGVQPYLIHDEAGGEYTVNDALFGSLQVTDGALPFDMTGAGSIQSRVIRIRDDGFIDSAPDDEGEPLYTPPVSGRN